MKANELREKSINELQEELTSLLRDQFNFRMQQATGQFGQTHLFKQVRKDIARLKTILQQKSQQEKATATK